MKQTLGVVFQSKMYYYLSIQNQQKLDLSKVAIKCHVLKQIQKVTTSKVFRDEFCLLLRSQLSEGRCFRGVVTFGICLQT